MKTKIFFIFLTLIFSVSHVGSTLFSAETPAGKSGKTPAIKNRIPVPVPDSRKFLEEEEFDYKDIAFFFRTLSLIKNAYADQEKVETKTLLHKALKGLLRELDPFSSYISDDQAKDLEEDTKGSFAGIGVSIMSRGHAVEIITVFDASPAEKAGVQSGDLLVSVDGAPVSGLDIAGCVKKIKGEKGTLVKLKLLRKGVNTPLELSVRRGEIKIKSIVNSCLLRNAFGYVRITHFSAVTADDLMKEIRKFKEKNIKGLIIDVRNNPGGLLVSAIGVSSIFLQNDVEVVSTSGHLPSSRKSFPSLDVPKAPLWPIVILINENSASAAEIFAGSLRDHRRAILAGTKSFGKGSVQTIMPLGGKEGALRLTTAKYYTPSKKVIHGKGIMPDIVIPISGKEQFLLNTGHLGRSMTGDKELQKAQAKDSQLNRALDILQGITLLKK